MAPHLDVRLLRPVEVIRDGHRVPLGRGTLTDLLATHSIC
jgi:hypothetical protein